MRTTYRYLLPVLLLGFVSGCSVFGIATKGDLKAQNEELTQSMAAQQQTLDDSLARVTGQLEAMESELYAAVADLDTRSQANATELAQARVRFETIQGQVQLALADLATVGEAASRAEAGSRQAVQMHHDAQVAERQRLQDRLRELETQINAWYAPTVPDDQLQRDLHPETGARNAVANTADNSSLPRAGLQIPESARKGN